MCRPSFGPAAIAVGVSVLGVGCSSLGGSAAGIDGLSARSAGELGATCPPAPSGIDPENRTALDITNAMRSVMGLPCLSYHPAIDRAASRHCRYLARNAAAAARHCIARPHAEVAGCEEYVAERFGERLSKAGYPGKPEYEVIAYENDGHIAVARWLNSVWHRVPLVSSLVADASYGHDDGCDTMDFGSGTVRPSPRTVVYPVPDQVNVPTHFDGLESPEPPSPPQGWPSGYPIIVHAPELRLSSHELTNDDTGESLAHIWLDPAEPEAIGRLVHESVLYSELPLERRTRYRVHLAGENLDGKPVVLDWTFTTR